MLATIIPATKIKNENNAFTYIVPDNLSDQVKIGSLVHIPFGNRNIRGIVKDLSPKHLINVRLKEIKSLDMDFCLPKIYLEIAKWVSVYYCCSLGESIALFLPPDLKRPRLKKCSAVQEVVFEKIRLNTKQKDIFDKLKQALLRPERPTLIHGVTGSGKTEVYIQLAKETIAQEKQVIVLVPEIILTPQTVERFQNAFGDQIALMHSNLSKSEKYQCFFDFYSGSKKILVGPRSALLVPNEKIGLIIIDEEQEDAYKQEQNPRYHAVTLAEKIALKTKSLLILGTATPRIETFYKAKTGLYDFFILDKRFGERELPKAKLIDLRNEIRSGNKSPISTELQAEITTVMNNKRQALLFLNRRGTSTFVSCRDCGFVKLCPNCSIPLVCHINDATEILSCHHCGHTEKSLTTCPQCGSPRIKYFGAGIDRIEKEVRYLFPEARVVKIDSSTFGSKLDYEKFYQRFKNHEIDIVIGTQIIAKGLDIPNLDLVGIVSADTGLNLPQYKASEKTFQIITQVSGRSGRRQKDGKTIIQTYWPESEAILCASAHDYIKFYETEVIERKKFGYPPFTHLVHVISEDPDQEKANTRICALVNKLETSKISFIGPGPCFYSKLHSKYRYHLIIKTNELPSEAIRSLWYEFDYLTFDVDPSNLL